MTLQCIEMHCTANSSQHWTPFQWALAPQMLFSGQCSPHDQQMSRKKQEACLTPSGALYVTMHHSETKAPNFPCSLNLHHNSHPGLLLQSQCNWKQFTQLKPNSCNNHHMTERTIIPRIFLLAPKGDLFLNVRYRCGYSQHNFQHNMIQDVKCVKLQWQKWPGELRRYAPTKV